MTQIDIPPNPDATGPGTGATGATQVLSSRLDALDRATSMLDQASKIGKPRAQARVLDCARRVLTQPGGIAELRARAIALEDAGVFEGTDWASPSNLLAALVGRTLALADSQTITLECLNLLRFLSAARDGGHSAQLSRDHAEQYLTQVLALNLDRLFGVTDEASRARASALQGAVDALLAVLLDEIGAKGILGRLVEEIWRILAQRPLMMGTVKSMILQIAIARTRTDGVAQKGDQGGQQKPGNDGSDRLISALFGPTDLSREDPGLEAYRQRIASADTQTLQREAAGFARAMHDTGLVSDYQTAFLRWILGSDQGHLLPVCLGLSSTGLDGLRCYEPLVRSLLGAATHPGTGQSILGLSMILERGILYSPPIAPSLWRLLELPLSVTAEAALEAAYGTATDPKSQLVAGVLMLLGQPLGIGQGNNPTCQSARALSMWALNDPDYLLWLVAQVIRTDNLRLHFEGVPMDTAHLPAGLAMHTPLDADPVSVLLVPHLDRAYAEMGRRCADQLEDPHRRINPELHGWWVGREFHIAVDVATGKLADFEGFVAAFFGGYHPLYNGNQPLIHPQPAGIAVTNSNGKFIGWHAISITRVALDQNSEMRVYFFNPNNDSGQDWGHGVVVSTHGAGERFGEGSLPFEEFTSRLYLFHNDGLSALGETTPPKDAIARTVLLAHQSWACDRIGS